MEINKDLTALTVAYDTTSSHGLATLMLDVNYFEHLQRVAKLMAASNLVPQQYKNVSDCTIALDMAYASGIRPLFLLQNTQVVKGNITWKGQAVIALINQSGRFAKPLDWEFKKNEAGEVTSATCFTQDADGNRKEATVTWDMVEGEGWHRNDKWRTMREQMFCYRSATFFGRRYTPDILAGIPTEGEQDDITSIKDITPRQSKKADALNEKAADSEFTPSAQEQVEELFNHE